MTARAFHAPKAGVDPEFWEDGCGISERSFRFLVCDGASTGYRAYDWSDLLVDEWHGNWFDATDVDQVRSWLDGAAQRWPEVVAAPPLVGEEASEEIPSYLRHATQQQSRTSYATVLAVEVGSLQGQPMWRAGAVGDTCLFHVRGNRLVSPPFPIHDPADFGSTPTAVSPDAESRAALGQHWLTAHGDVQPGDLLLGLTDALAKWALAHPRRADALYTLARVDHETFPHLVDDLRANGELDDDDVTLVVTHLG